MAPGTLPSKEDQEAMWENDDTQLWASYLAGYDEAISLKSKDGLVEAEDNVWNKLPKKVLAKARQPLHLTGDEYRAVVDWKLLRGKFRPSLKGYAKKIEDGQVVQATTDAYSKLPKSTGKHKTVSDKRVLLASLEPLIKLKGCGPATASALVAMMDNSFPFMSDELLEMTVGKKYTKAAYTELIKAAREKARKLSSGTQSWTAKDVERAAFAFMNNVQGSPAGKSKGDFIAEDDCASSPDEDDGDEEHVEQSKDNIESTGDSLVTHYDEEEVSEPKKRRRGRTAKTSPVVQEKVTSKGFEASKDSKDTVPRRSKRQRKS